jgi:hypothetical protein
VKFPQLGAEVDVAVIPDQQDDPVGQLMAGDDQQVPVPGSGERLGLALATAIAGQPTAVTGPATGQPGDRDVPGAAMTGRIPRRPRLRDRGAPEPDAITLETFGREIPEA